MTDDGVGGSDPEVVETVVVHAEDVVTAYEARTRNDERAVLRVTPPFSARMRARIHVHRPGEYDGQDAPRPIHLDPGQLLGEDCPAYPEPDETASEIDDGERPDPETHYEHHREAVAEWRERAAEHVRDSAAVEYEGETFAVDVAVLHRSA
jgi:hypothetical protein